MYSNRIQKVHCVFEEYILDKQRNVIWPLSSINYSFPKVNVDSLRLYFPDFKHILYRELLEQFKPSILIHIDLMVGDQPVHAQISIRLNKCQEKVTDIVDLPRKTGDLISLVLLQS